MSALFFETFYNIGSGSFISLLALSTVALSSEALLVASTFITFHR